MADRDLLAGMEGSRPCWSEVPYPTALVNGFKQSRKEFESAYVEGFTSITSLLGLLDHMRQAFHEHEEMLQQLYCTEQADLEIHRLKLELARAKGQEPKGSVYTAPDEPPQLEGPVRPEVQQPVVEEPLTDGELQLVLEGALRAGEPQAVLNVQSTLGEDVAGPPELGEETAGPSEPDAEPLHAEGLWSRRTRCPRWNKRHDCPVDVQGKPRQAKAPAAVPVAASTAVPSSSVAPVAPAVLAFAVDAVPGTSEVPAAAEAAPAPSVPAPLVPAPSAPAPSAPALSAPALSAPPAPSVLPAPAAAAVAAMPELAQAGGAGSKALPAEPPANAGWEPGEVLLPAANDGSGPAEMCPKEPPEATLASSSSSGGLTGIRLQTLVPVRKELKAAEFGYGHRPWDTFEGRWVKIGETLKEYFADEDEFTVFDIGSGTGYFSLQIASAFPQSLVTALEGEDGSSRQQSEQVKTYWKWIKKLGLTNCVTDSELWDFRVVKRLREEDFHVDVMLLLSVFHYIDKLSSQGNQYLHCPPWKGTVQLMANILCLASLTFIELPNLGDGLRSGDPDRLPHVYRHYDTAAKFLEAAMAFSERLSGVKKELQGPIYSGSGAHWIGTDDQANRLVYVVVNVDHKAERRN